ncbi:NAD(P)H-dependent oxidoreductase [uncultured Akkermansia sp.]|uniref:NAD(P)H-dependent oxidoreductase n=1 Tax=uncultured Akkermansia sp. TaxID=512294 RepID=UPI00265CD536|nr:NAD(P)H-dependent oxidoreductase [uncultured Akkermansia sp.]
MNISVILGHPYPYSFNAAIAATTVQALKEQGHTIRFHDLCREQFNPVLPDTELISDVPEDALTALHQQEIREADGIVIIHPNWWGQPPAIMKGWIDRVLREEVAYTFPKGDNGGGLPIGLLKAKAALVFNTSNTPEERERNVFGDPLERIWKDCIFAFCGVHVFERKMFHIIAASTPDIRAKWLEEVRETVRSFFPLESEPR